MRKALFMPGTRALEGGKMPKRRRSKRVGETLNSPWLGCHFVCRIIFSRALITTLKLQQRRSPQGRKAVPCVSPPPRALQSHPLADLRHPFSILSWPPRRARRLPAAAKRPLTACHFSADAGIRARARRAREERGGGVGARGLLPLHPRGPR